MLPLFLVLFCFGSYCSSAPVTNDLSVAIQETLQKVEAIQKSELQGPLETPDNIMEKRCKLKNLNTFIESIKSSNTNPKIKLLLINLQYIKNRVEEREPNLKELQTECEFAEECFKDFKEKLTHFLKFIHETFRSLY